MFFLAYLTVWVSQVQFDQDTSELFSIDYLQVIRAENCNEFQVLLQLLPRFFSLMFEFQDIQYSLLQGRF